MRDKEDTEIMFIHILRIGKSAGLRIVPDYGIRAGPAQ